MAYIYICHFCDKPTFFGDGIQTPGALFGNLVSGIDDNKIKSLYNEARKSFGAGSSTAVVLCCRKLLMHIAVDKGAKEGQNFIDYVDYLSKKNYIPPGSEGWVDHIRKKGNEANHEIIIMDENDAKDLLTFTEMLLRLIFEFPERVKKLNPKN